MSIAEKRKKIRQYLNTADDRFLNMVYALMEEYTKQPIKLSNSEKQAIEQGIQSLEEHGAIPHEQVMKEMKQKYPHLHR